MFRSLLRSIKMVALSLLVLGAGMAWAAEGAAPHGAAEPAAHHGAGGSAEHPPELPLNFMKDLALFSVVTFVLYLIVLRLGAWNPLMAGLNERERRIRQDIADAEANRVKSEQLIAEREVKLAKVHEEVRELLAEARRDADRMRQEIVTTAQNEAQSMKQRAVAEIERARDQALAELFDFVANNVIGATERVVGRSLSDGDQERLVTQALAEMNVRRN